MAGHDKKSLPSISPTTTTVYIFSGSKVIAEYDNSAAVGSPSREYIYSGVALLAKLDSSGTKYYHQDHLSNRLVTDSRSNTFAQMGHFPYGESWYNATNDKLIFTTYERDSESGNDYAMARYSMSRLGRFSSPDPLAGSVGDPQSLNRYDYTRDNPVNLVDPSGRRECEPAGCTGDQSGGGPEDVICNDSGCTIYVTVNEPLPPDAPPPPLTDPYYTGPWDGGGDLIGVNGPIFGGLAGGGGSGPAPPPISDECKKALKAARQNTSALSRATQYWSTFEAAADYQGIDVSIVAAIAVRETGVQNIYGDNGHGQGMFQIDDRSYGQVDWAFNISVAATFAAGLLRLNNEYYTSNGYGPAGILYGTIRGYNAGHNSALGNSRVRAADVSGVPQFADVGTSPGNPNYVTNVLHIARDCFN